MSAGVHARAGADVSFRDVTIKIPDRGRHQGCDWRHVPEAWAEIFQKRQLVESCRPKKKGDFRLLAEALWWVPHVVWGGSKSHYRKMVSLSLYRKTFKLKGNKIFRTWTKKSQVFFVFRDSYVLYIWVMNIICTFHISVPWVCYTKARFKERRVSFAGNAPLYPWFESVSSTYFKYLVWLELGLNSHCRTF